MATKYTSSVWLGPFKLDNFERFEMTDLASAQRGNAALLSQAAPWLRPFCSVEWLAEDVAERRLATVVARRRRSAWRHVAGAVFLGVVLVAGGLYAGRALQSLPPVASAESRA